MNYRGGRHCSFIATRHAFHNISQYFTIFHKNFLRCAYCTKLHNFAQFFTKFSSKFHKNDLSYVSTQFCTIFHNFHFSHFIFKYYFSFYFSFWNLWKVILILNLWILILKYMNSHFIFKFHFFLILEIMKCHIIIFSFYFFILKFMNSFFILFLFYFFIYFF